MSDSLTPAETDAASGVDPAAAAASEVVTVREGMFGVAGSGDTSGYGGLRTPVLAPAASPRPFGGYFDTIADALAAVLPDPSAAITSIVIDRDQMILHVDRDHLLDVATALRNDPALRFELSLGVSGVHFPDDTGRELRAIYPLLSITHNRRVLLEVSAPDDDPRIPSLVSLYPTCDWHERETFDFFGIVFEGHLHLTRIEMPDDWIGHPQRKDYPLGGIPVEYKGAEIPPPDQRRAYH
jgi:NADH-quinone oxidoreductase subunit C